MLIPPCIRDYFEDKWVKQNGFGWVIDKGQLYKWEIPEQVTTYMDIYLMELALQVWKERIKDSIKRTRWMGFWH